MRGRRVLSLAVALGAAFAVLSAAVAQAENPRQRPAPRVVVEECVYMAHGSTIHRAKGGNPGKPDNPGNGGGGESGAKCFKTFGSWGAGTIHVYVDGANGPQSISAATLESYVQHALEEWSCRSGLGEAFGLQMVDSAAAADITVAWGDLGSTGILGQAATARLGKTIVHSDITMNSNQAAFTWTAGPVPLVDAHGCAIEDVNDPFEVSFDLLSVLTHEIGHAFGIDHPVRQCDDTHACYPETMFPCTDAGEFMRRALDPGDEAAIASLYGTDS